MRQVVYSQQAEQFLERCFGIAKDEYGVYMQIRFDWTDDHQNFKDRIFIKIGKHPRLERAWIEPEPLPEVSYFDAIEVPETAEFKSRRVYTHTYALRKLHQRTINNLRSAGHMARFFVLSWEQVKYQERTD